MFLTTKNIPNNRKHWPFGQLCQPYNDLFILSWTKAEQTSSKIQFLMTSVDTPMWASNF